MSPIRAAGCCIEGRCLLRGDRRRCRFQVGKVFFSRDAKSQSLGLEGIVTEHLYSWPILFFGPVEEDFERSRKGDVARAHFLRTIYNNILLPDEITMPVLVSA